MDVIWDQNKNQLNRAKHKLDFADAQEVLEGECLVSKDCRKDYGEERYIAMGELRGRLIVLVYTVREGKCRVISMRKANEREQKAYKNRLE